MSEATTSRPRVVVVGGGFAGLQAARGLDGAPVSVTLVDRRNFHLFQPLLYQVATAALDPSDIAHPLRSVLQRQDNVDHVIMASVEDVDLEGRRVHLDDGESLDYDFLVLATGATHSYFGNDQWSAVAPGLKTVEDALEIRRRLLTAFERADRDPRNAETELTFVVVGAGPTGVELAGAIREIAMRGIADDYENVDPERARVVLVEGLDGVLPTYPEDLQRRAQEQLEELGVEVILGHLTVEVDDEGVTLDDDRRIDARTVLWAAGTRASAIGERLPDHGKDGRVSVNEDLSIEGHPEVFVTGDLARVEHDGEEVPALAPAAMQQGRHAAKQIRASLEGRDREPFRYHDRGSLATIGRARAVGELPMGKISGLAAWLAWTVVHVAFLVGFRNRFSVLGSWAWNYLTAGPGSRLITHPRRDGPVDPSSRSTED